MRVLYHNLKLIIIIGYFKKKERERVTFTIFTGPTRSQEEPTLHQQKGISGYILDFNLPHQ